MHRHSDTVSRSQVFRRLVPSACVNGVVSLQFFLNLDNNVAVANYKVIVATTSMAKPQSVRTTRLSKPSLGGLEVFLF